MARLSNKKGTTMKKRIKISTLLNRYRTKEKTPTVIIRGSQTGAILYEGSLWYVPFLLCTDYAQTYEYHDGQLEIVSTCFPF